MIAEYNGLLKVKPEALAQLNGIGQIVFATLHSNHQVKANQAVSGTRVIPLIVSAQEVMEAENLCRSAFPLVEVKPFRSLRVGMVTTGSEVYSGRVKDAFGPVVEKKFQELGSAILRQELTSDEDLNFILNILVDKKQVPIINLLSSWYQELTVG